MRSHDIHLVERLVASGTLAQPVDEPIIQTLAAKHVAAPLQDTILKVVTANRAESQLFGLQY